MDVDMQAVVMKIFVPKNWATEKDNEGNSGMFFKLTLLHEIFMIFDYDMVYYYDLSIFHF